MAELTVPESLYGMALAEPLALNLKHDGCLIFIIEFIRTYCMLALNYVIQGLFLYEIAQVVQDHYGDGCTDEHLYLQLMCVFVFEVSIFHEFRNSCDLFCLLWHAPSSKYEQANKHAYDRILGLGANVGNSPGGAILADEAGSTGRFGKAFRTFRPPAHPDIKPWTLRGFSRLYKVWSTLIIAVPKLALDLLLAMYGSEYIAKSGDREAMIQNTLAVNFVLQVDRILYQAFTSEHTKASLSHMDPVIREVSNRVRFMTWAMNTVVYPLIVLTGTFAIVFYSKYRECDSYSAPIFFS